MNEFEWIKGALKRQGKTQAALAAAMGLDPSQVTRLLKATRRLRLDELKTVSTFLEMPIPEEIAALAPRGNDEGRRVPMNFVGESEIPVYSAAEGGSGETVVSTDPIELVTRPWYLKNVKDGYAVMVTGESMEPRYSPGEIVIINPKAALVRGKDVIVHTAIDGGDFRAVIKAYAGSTVDSWKLVQYNPPPGQLPEITLRKKEWPFAVRVVGRYAGG